MTATEHIIQNVGRPSKRKVKKPKRSAPYSKAEASSKSVAKKNFTTVTKINTIIVEDTEVLTPGNLTRLHELCHWNSTPPDETFNKVNVLLACAEQNPEFPRGGVGPRIYGSDLWRKFLAAATRASLPYRSLSLESDWNWDQFITRRYANQKWTQADVDLFKNRQGDASPIPPNKSGFDVLLYEDTYGAPVRPGRAADKKYFSYERKYMGKPVDGNRAMPLSLYSFPWQNEGKEEVGVGDPVMVWTAAKAVNLESGKDDEKIAVIAPRVAYYGKVVNIRDRGPVVEDATTEDDCLIEPIEFSLKWNYCHIPLRHAHSCSISSLCCPIPPNWRVVIPINVQHTPSCEWDRVWSMVHSPDQIILDFGSESDANTQDLTLLHYF
jgi:hypothetical protein